MTTLTQTQNDLIAQLRAICGTANVLTHEDPSADLSPWEQDWRKRVHGRALAVVRPGDTAQVAAVVKACAATGTSIVPQGGNTGLVVGGVPDGSGTQIVLSMTRMNAVRAIDPANLTITVEAGCVLKNLQTAAENAGFLFPLSLGAEGSAPSAATWAPTRAARRSCATATPASSAWAWKWSPHKARSGTA